VNLKSEWVIPPQYTGALAFAEDRAAVEVAHRKWGYVDHTGEMVIEANFDRAGSFLGGVAGIEIGGEYGYIDLSGNFLWSGKK
jgi:hypothetical protein